MNAPEAKGRTCLSPGAFIGDVEALKECPRPDTLFERIKRSKNLLILRLDQPARVKRLDKEKMSIITGTRCSEQPGFAVGASRGLAGRDIVTANIQPN